MAKVKLMVTERFIPWVKILKNTTWWAGIIQKPLVKILNPKAHIIPEEQDVLDIWTNGHALMGALFTTMGLGFEFPWWGAILFGNTIMLLYETYIDGNRKEDPRGASIRDLGANLIGSVSAAAFYMFAKLVRSWL